MKIEYSESHEIDSEIEIRVMKRLDNRLKKLKYLLLCDMKYNKSLTNSYKV